MVVVLLVVLLVTASLRGRVAAQTVIRRWLRAQIRAAQWAARISRARLLAALSNVPHLLCLQQKVPARSQSLAALVHLLQPVMTSLEMLCSGT